MEQGRHRIEVDTARQLICVALSGFFCVDEVRRYALALRDAFARHAMRPGYAIMIDIGACSIQPQDVIAAFQQHMAGFPKRGGSRW